MYESLLYPWSEDPIKIISYEKILQTPNKLGILQTSKINELAH